MKKKTERRKSSLERVQLNSLKLRQIERNNFPLFSADNRRGEAALSGETREPHRQLASLGNDIGPSAQDLLIFFP